MKGVAQSPGVGEGAAIADPFPFLPPGQIGVSLRGHRESQSNPDPKAVAMQQLLSITLAVSLVPLISQLAAAQQAHYAIVKAKTGAAVPEILTAGLFDEHWQLVK